MSQKYLMYHEEPRDWITTVYWLWGDDPYSLENIARGRSTGERVFVKTNGSKFWDGYDGHETVIVENFKEQWWDANEMCRLLDRYETRVEIRYGSRQFRPKKIIVTCVFPPDVIYKKSNDDPLRLLRRITSIEKF